MKKVRHGVKPHWLLAGLAVFGLSGGITAAADTTSPATVWEANTPEEVAAEIEHQKELAEAYYEIIWGDTLWAISRATGIPVTDLVTWNRVDDPDLIYAGDQLVGVLRPVDPGEDTTPPVLVSVAFEQPSYTAGGETVTVHAEITDDMSGISSAQLYMMNEATGREGMIQLTAVEGDHFSGTMAFDPREGSGTWAAHHMVITDTAGNEAVYYPDVSFEWTNPNGDAEAPVLQSVQFNQPAYTVNDTVIVTVEAVDSQSLIATAHLGLYNTNSNTYKTVYLTMEEAGIFSGTMNFDPNEVPGTWRIDYIALIDELENGATYYPDVTFELTE